MTLALAIISRHGVWMSSDHRLVNLRTGRPEADRSTKQFGFRINDTDVGVISYSGIGRVDSEGHVSQLLVELLRGEDRSLDATLRAIEGFANQRIANAARRMSLAHTFIFGGFERGRALAGVITNVGIERRAYPVDLLTIEDRFLRVVNDVTNEGAALVTGQRHRVGAADLGSLNRARRNRPRNPDQYRELLAEITRRVGRRYPKGVSETSDVVQIIPPNLSLEYRPSDGGDATVSYGPRMLMHGIDAGALLKNLMDSVHGVPVDFETAGREAVRVAVGSRLVDRQSRRRGRVAADPPASGSPDEFDVEWDSTPGAVIPVKRNSAEVLYPGHPEAEPTP
jgi:hypothetical protein